MLRYALRRVLWVFPSVLGVSVIAFFVLSLRAAPSPAELHALPLFFNMEPRDVRARAQEALLELTTHPPDSARAQSARVELGRLGGAALPYLLIELDVYDPSTRVEVALALAPVADRMGFGRSGEATDPKRVVLFWQRFWQTRGIEFRPANARSAVARYARYGTEARAEQIRMLDTFALPALIDSLNPPEDQSGVVRTRRLVALIDAMVGRGATLPADATIDDAHACIDGWTRWWLLNRTQFISLTGGARVAASVLETRYGKWVLEALMLKLGTDHRGRPILDELVRSTRVTLTIVAFGVLIAYVLALVLGSLSAWRRGAWPDGAIAAATLLPFVISPAVLAVLVSRSFGPFPDGTVVAVLLLAAVLVADPTRHQRAAMMTILARDYVRAAVARGVRPWRVIAVHALRNTALPVVTRLSVELPVALTACFVIEHALGLHGLGEATLAAVRHADTRWLMAIAVLSATWAVLALVVSDVLYAVMDPRLRAALGQVTRRRT